MVIYKSHLPNLQVPKSNVYSFVTSNPNKTPDTFPLLVDSSSQRVITFGDWKRDTRRWATGLKSIGFAPGDVLALFSFNQIDYSVTLFGPMILGGACTTVNSSYSAGELAYQLKDSGASVLVTHSELLEVAIEGACLVGISLDRIFLYGDQTVQGFRPYTSLMPIESTPENQLAQIANLDVKAVVETIAMICYSSGTTGRSKGVELTHTNLSMNTLQTSAMQGPIHPHENPILSILPMFHSYSIQMHMLSGVYNGQTNVVMERFVFGDFLASIQDYKVKTLNLVPPQVLMLVKSPLVDNYDLSQVRQVMAAAAPCSKELVEALLHKFPEVSFRQGYGMTELSCASHLGLYEEIIIGSAGRVIPNQEVRVVDPETRQDVTPGDSGEVWVRGPNVMKGYRNNAKATRETIDSEGWLHTGDIAIVDSNENFFIVDRLKELIKNKGFQVAPAELEAVLLTHPQILDATVIGIDKKEQATEVPLAFVVRRSSTLTENQIIEFVTSRVANHKKLRGGVQFVDAIPKSASGKILRKNLRSLLQHKMGQQAQDKDKEEMFRARL
ncbi:putative fatty-acid--CoA ligase FadD10 [Linnemannia elongata]|nr:putative fatty-acid--CoA ligase FadD10 [Linnemannia elongata]